MVHPDPACVVDGPADGGGLPSGVERFDGLGGDAALKRQPLQQVRPVCRGQYISVLQRRPEMFGGLPVRPQACRELRRTRGMDEDGGRVSAGEGVVREAAVVPASRDLELGEHLPVQIEPPRWR